jgi:hypothetical protein
MTQSTWRVGDKVMVDHTSYPGVWTVTKVNPKNLRLEQEGRNRGLNAPKYLCIPAGDNPVAAIGRPMGVRTLPHQDAGSVVRYIGNGDKIAHGALFIVLADKGDKVNITPLGGDGGRYWRMPPRNLEAVPNARLVVDAA